MLLVLPFSTSDWGLAQSLLVYMKDLGTYDNHKCLVVHPPNAADYAEGIVTAAREVFPEVDVFQTVRHEDGWPKGPNYNFLNAAFAVYQNSKYTGPFYFFEADNTPQHAGWLDKLETEYNQAQKLYMGTVVPTRAIRAGVEIEFGTHMVGTGVYPKDVAKRSVLLKTLRYQKIPWDIYLQNEIVPNCTDSKSIQHIWNVQNVRRRGKSVVCSANHANSKPVPIRTDALVVHGVKDGSLMKLRQEERASDGN